jgi:putative endonuclease
MTWFVYLLRCRDDSLYAGMTNDLEKRFRQHQNGYRATWTSSRRPVTLVHVEKYESRREAAMRERELKGMRREKKERLLAGSLRPPLAGSG